MGGRLSKSRARVAVDESARLYSKPTGMVVHRNIDLTRLRSLVLSGKLAPCFPGVDEPDEAQAAALEECPICFLFYPALNRSRCCQKGLCTECFLQVKAPAHQHVACPFCKELGYAVVYRGKKSAEELQRELQEDQRVIEARIRARQTEAAAATVAPPSGRHSRAPSGSVPVPQPAAAAAAAAATPPSTPSTPLTALPMLSSPTPGSFCASGAGLDARDEARRRAAFLASSSPSSAGGGSVGADGGAAALDARRLGRLADYLPAGLVARTAGGSIDLEDLMLMEGIWLSLQASQAGGGGGDAGPASGARGAPDERQRAASSDEEDENDHEPEPNAFSSADGERDAMDAPAGADSAFPGSGSLPSQAVSAAPVARGPLSRRPSDIGGTRPSLGRGGGGGGAADASLQAQLRFWGAHATPAAAAAAEEEMMAMAVRMSLEEAQPQPSPPPAADAAAAAPEPAPQGELWELAAPPADASGGCPAPARDAAAAAAPAGVADEGEATAAAASLVAAAVAAVCHAATPPEGAACA